MSRQPLYILNSLLMPQNVCFYLKSPFRGFIVFVCSDSFTYIVIIEGFLPNISCQGKDFVATWFPGFPLLSHPGVN